LLHEKSEGSLTLILLPCFDGRPHKLQSFRIIPTVESNLGGKLKKLGILRLQGEMSFRLRPGILHLPFFQFFRQSAEILRRDGLGKWRERKKKKEKKEDKNPG
jgi:hypothetical protein